MDGHSSYQQTDQRDRKLFRVALVAAPWTLFHRPSIQLASLRSYLLEQADYPVDCQHLYLAIAKQIGIDCYTRIARSGWAGEALFAALLFPEKKEAAARLFHSELRGDGRGAVPDFSLLVTAVRGCCKTWEAGTDWRRLSLVGFSLCFNQLLASLYLAQRLKAQAADLPIVFGGTLCAGALGRSLIERFAQIDYLIDGEGEGPLLALCEYLEQRRETLPDRIMTAAGRGGGASGADIAPLDDLPIPDYQPYFTELRQLFADLPFLPTLPVEFSRGCSWQRCTFCNLNLQWHGYRAKQAARMIDEIRKLSVRHESLHFAFTDNVLPARAMDDFFRTLAETPLDITFFGELRATTSPERLGRYRRGGLRSVQVGIESLSTTLLKRMGKGTTAMDNLAMMKNCSAAGIELLGNIITEFPGTSPAEIAETIDHLDYALPFAPLTAASFFLGYGSPIFRQPREYGIGAILPHPKYRALFPDQCLGTLLVSGYRGDRTRQKKLWRPVRRKIAAWQEFHRRRRDREGPALGYRDGGSFLVISQERPGRPSLLHRLRGVSRELYLYCDQPRSMEEIRTAFPRLRPAAIDGFIDQLCRKRLMVREAGRVLALAVRVA
ncbi:MAG: RiPP maturation radical SAM C-methyltransferase [Desulfofustis sp.]|nr:RiPP maturation radical SAM C-methyltransferase [Desulfofustis sp.]